MVDSETKTPLEGAVVSVTYSKPFPLSIFKDGIVGGTTGAQGNVILSTRFADAKTYYNIEAKIINDNYDDQRRMGTDDEEIVISLDSKIIQEKKQLALAERARIVDDTVKRLLAGPDAFWPIENEMLLPDQSNFDTVFAHRNYVYGRWESATKEFLGSALDRAEIIQLVKIRYGVDIDEYRWLNPKHVMVSASSAGPAGAGYICILQKTETGWVMLRGYLQWVS